jgi:hypothetical protein
LRERNMSRHTRATTVVSHPPRFSMPAVSERLNRSQASRFVIIVTDETRPV